MALAAFYFFRTQTIYISLPLILLATCILVLVILGGLYAAGAITGETYAGATIAIVIVFVLLLLVAGGAYLFLRLTRRY
jgi:hypothetical protein